MMRSPLWREFESGDSFPVKMLRRTILFGGVFFLLFTGILELTWPQQAVLGLLTILLATWLDRSSTSYLLTLTMMLVSMFSTFRYAYWRVATTVKFFNDPGTQWTALDAFFIWLLVLAEAYAFLILYLGYLQTLWPLRRMPVPLPDETGEWPEIDLLIPTYTEPLSVVRYTALAAINIDWPVDKLNVYLLDDGNREEFRRFAEEAGIGYMTREDNAHAKAGNINRALERLDAPFVAIFDCDHVPTRSFLQVTMGWFLRDRKLAMLQTPHHFYSPDPFERNLDQFRVIPNEGELFYGVVQDGNDFWNATFFCGSCAVLRRTALDEIGGIAVETVTEDAHTSLRMQMQGWNTAYINIPQAAGLATERLSRHVKQRIRWARGMIQILRVDNPLFAAGLSPAQRLCYFNAMSHFLYALPRLIFLTAPLIYLLLGKTNVPGYWGAILVYAIPHLVLSALTNSRIQGQHRHSFWNEIYETVLSPYILLPTMLALVSPKLGSFNVTTKGGVVHSRFFDTRIAQPFLIMILMNTFGLLVAIPRYFYVQFWPLSGMYDGDHRGTIMVNVLWTMFNIMVLGVATAVAWESQQRRHTVRVPMSVPADIQLANGLVVQGATADLSTGGARLEIDRTFTARPGDAVQLIFPVSDGAAMLPATVVNVKGGSLSVQFAGLTLAEEETLTMVMYSRADTWLGWGEAREVDRPVRSLLRILRISAHGLSLTVRGLLRPRRRASKRRLTARAVPLLLLLGVLAGSGRDAPGQAVRGAERGVGGGVGGHAIPPGSFDNTFSLAEVGVPETIVLRGVDAYHTVTFSVPQTEVIKTATMHLRFHFSPGLLPAISHLKVSLNGALFATLPVTGRPLPVSEDVTPEQKVAEAQELTVSRNEANALLEATLVMPAEMLVHENELTFEFIGHYTLQCEDPSHSTLWSHVDASSTIELTGSLLPLQNDLSLLPLPFYDAAVNLHPSISIVFLTPPSSKALRAAGMVASYFGMLTDFRAVHFQVSLGTIPVGNAVVLGERAAELPIGLNVTSTSGPTIAMRTNPMDPYSKLLVLTGDDGDDLVMAAEVLVLQRAMLQGDQQRVQLTNRLVAREPDDAPRWLSTDRVTYLGDMTSTADIEGDGSVPVGAYLRVPPDLCLQCVAPNLSFHMGYRYNGIPLASESTLQVYMNSAYMSSTPMPHTEKGSSVLETVVPVPTVDLRPFSNSLMMRFVFQIAKKGRCQDTAPLNLQGAILKSSYLDIKGIPHLAVMPNLELFANAGYPFTRMADLSDTAVVLPDSPTTDEAEMYLSFMGHFGAQTGYPVLNVTVTNAAGMNPKSGKDYLVMGTVDDQPAIATLNPSLPVTFMNDGLHIQDTQGFFAPLQHAWWKVKSSDHVQSGQLETAGGLPDALVEGLEWPSGSNRSVVLVALRDHSVAPRFVDSFLRTSQSSDLSQSVGVLRGERFVSYRIGNDVYKVGSLSWWVRVNLLFSEFPWLVVVSTMLICLFIAALIRAALRRKARGRLQGEA